MAKIKDLPKLERPREKALRYGIDKLSIAELLAIIIGSGTVKFSALDIANELLKQFGGLAKLSRVTLDKLLKIKGVNNAIALKILATFELVNCLIRICEVDDFDYKHRLKGLAEKYRKLLLKKRQEELHVVCFDRNHFIANESMIYRGTKQGSESSIEEILTIVKENNCTDFVMIHNHPLGGEEPSDADIAFTYDLAMEAHAHRLSLKDHLIVTKDKTISIFGLFE